MRLVIVDREGQVHEVTDELEAWDLSKPLARADLCEQVLETVNRIPEVQR